jgi:membrane fusion protein (multidrug efflux system)
VYVVAPGDTVVTRDVEPGPWSGNLWIIEKGLAPGDRVVVDGVQKAAPGRPVRAVALADSAIAGPEETATAGATAGPATGAAAGASSKPSAGTTK